MDKTLKYLLDFAVITVIYIFLFKKWRTKGACVVIANTIMYLYLTAVLFVTLMPLISSLPFIMDHPYTFMNMIPFDDYFNNRGDTVRQIVLNVIMTIPFGFLLPVCKECSRKNHGIIQCVLFSSALSICIEFLQPLISGSRSADITDVITNTLGGVFGYLLFLLLRTVITKLIRKRNS